MKIPTDSPPLPTRKTKTDNLSGINKKPGLSPGSYFIGYFF